MARMSAPTANHDPRPAFFAAADQLVRLVTVIAPQDLGRPTPCDDFDVATLAGHLLCVLRRITHVATGGAYADVPQVVTGIDPGSWGATIAADRDAMRAVWSDEAVLDRLLVLPPGVEVPGRVGAVRYTQEMVTHAWDLAAAMDRRDELDSGLAAPLVEPARRFVPRERAHFPFGDVVEVPEDAGPYDQLVGWLGRDPSWSPADAG